MSDEVEYDEANDPAGLRKRADKALKRVAELEAELAKTQRQALFAEAGIPAEGAGKYFRKGYDGDLSIEAIRAEAEAAGLLNTEAAAKAVEEEEEPAELAAEKAALNVARQTQAGGDLPNSGGREEQFLAQMREASSPDELAEIYARYRGA